MTGQPAIDLPADGASGWLRDTPLELRRRPDLQFSRRWVRGSIRWAVKDPVALRYFLLSPLEFALLSCLDGRHTLTQLVHKIERKFSPVRVDLQQLMRFVTDLHRDGLLMSTRSAESVKSRWLGQLKRKRAERLANWCNPLYVRWSGWNPSPLLNWLVASPRRHWLPTLFLSGACLWIGAIAMLVAKGAEFWGGLSDFDLLFSLQHVGCLALVFVIIKACHELGHGWANRYFGAETPELGCVFVLGWPVLYCNVSDSWMLASKWQRMAVAAAGMGVELIIAAGAIVVWGITGPGSLNTLSRSVALICSVNTLLVNGNPCMRLDGYYVLADWLEIPNLWSRSRQRWLSWLLQVTLGLPPQSAPTEAVSTRRALAIYGLLSILYQLVLLAGITWLVYQMLERYHLAAMFPVVLGVITCGALGAVFVPGVRYMRHPGHRRQIRWSRAGGTFAMAALVLAVVLGVPWPRSVTGVGTVQPREPQPVFAETGGRLMSAVAEGACVGAGDVLAELENLELQQAVEAARGAYLEQVEVVQSLHAQGRAERRAVAVAVAERDRLEQHWRQLGQKLARQKILAPRAGIVCASTAVAGAEEEETLMKWNGSPLDEANRHCYLQPGTVLCVVGDSDRLQATAALTQTDALQVRPGQRVKVWLPSVEACWCWGTVRSVSKHSQNMTARDVLQEREEWTQSDWQLLDRPHQSVHEVVVDLEATPVAVVAGKAVDVVIEVDASPLWRRIRDWWYRAITA